VMSGEVRIEEAELRRELGEGDPERLHAPSLDGRRGPGQWGGGRDRGARRADVGLTATA